MIEKDPSLIKDKKEKKRVRLIELLEGRWRSKNFIKFEFKNEKEGYGRWWASS